jgi:hypothetical protein
MRVLTLSILQFLQNNGFGTIDQDLFWEKLGLGRDGLYISDLGASQSRTTRPNTGYSIYCRAKDDLTAYAKLQEVADFIRASYGVCNLPAAEGYTDDGFGGVTLMPPSTISNNGQDENGRVIYSITGQVYYSPTTNTPDPPVPVEGEAIATEMGVLIITEAGRALVKE